MSDAAPLGTRLLATGRIRHSQVRDNRAAALRHAVQLGLGHVQAFAHRAPRDDAREREHTLAAHAGEEEVVLHR